MFAYDSTRDVYKEVGEVEEVYVISRRSSSLSLKSSKSLKSLKSTRSYIRENFVARILTKFGRHNIFLTKLPNKHLLYIKDLATTLVHTQWRWILSTLGLVCFLSFFIFGLVWSLLDHMSNNECVVNADTYTGYVLLSIETIMTIGYGLRYPTEKCHGLVWVVLSLQVFISVAIQGVLVGAVYVKISKPYTKDSLQLFSKKATISMRDGQLCFIIRIVDVFGRVSVGTKVTMYFIDKNMQGDNTIFHENVQQLKIQPHGFLVFPLEIEHVIDETSPLWTMTPKDFLNKKFEIVAVVEGSSTVTGQLSQNRTSYINSNVLWGYRFMPCVDYNPDKIKYTVYDNKINGTIPFNTPLCSARELELFRTHLDE